MSERREFVALVLAGSVSFAEVCRRFGISRTTGYLWLGRYRDEGDAGLVDRSRRPLSSPNRTSAEIEDMVVKVREDHEAWGGRKINQVLRRRGVAGVPAPSTITGILRRHGKLDPQAPPLAYTPFEHDKPNELWQMDFKGKFMCGDGTECHTFGMLDDHSRFNLALTACPNEQTGTVKSILTATFDRYGLPKRILCDNGSPWGVNEDYQWTTLGVWLLDLGIGVTHSRPYHPQTAGKQERFHRTLDLEVLATRPVWDTLAIVQAAYGPWRHIYNHERPHDSLGDLTVPADRYQPSPRTIPNHIPDPEYPHDYTTRKVSNNYISWKGHRYRIGKPFNGRYVGVAPTTTHSTYNIYYRHQHIRTIKHPPPTP